MSDETIAECQKYQKRGSKEYFNSIKSEYDKIKLEKKSPLLTTLWKKFEEIYISLGNPINCVKSKPQLSDNIFNKINNILNDFEQLGNQIITEIQRLSLTAGGSETWTNFVLGQKFKNKKIKSILLSKGNFSSYKNFAKLNKKERTNLINYSKQL